MKFKTKEIAKKITSNLCVLQQVKLLVPQCGFCPKDKSLIYNNNKFIFLSYDIS